MQIQMKSSQLDFAQNPILSQAYQEISAVINNPYGKDKIEAIFQIFTQAIDEITKENLDIQSTQAEIIEALGVESQILTTSNDKFMLNQEELKKTIQILAEKTESLAKSKQLISQDNVILKQDLDKVIHDKVNLQNVQFETVVENKKLAETVDKLFQEKNDLMVNQNEFAIKLEKAEIDKDELSNDVKLHKEKEAKLKGKINKIKIANAELQVKLEDLTAKNHELDSNIEQIKSKNEKLTFNNHKLNSKLEDTEVFAKKKKHYERHDSLGYLVSGIWGLGGLVVSGAAFPAIVLGGVSGGVYYVAKTLINNQHEEDLKNYAEQNPHASQKEVWEHVI